MLLITALLSAPNKPGRPPFHSLLSGRSMALPPISPWFGRFLTHRALHWRTEETGQLERGPSVEAPDRVFDSIGEGLGLEEPELEALPGKIYESSTLKIEMPVLQRPPGELHPATYPPPRNKACVIWLRLDERKGIWPPFFIQGKSGRQGMVVTRACAVALPPADDSIFVQPTPSSTMSSSRSTS